MDNVMWSAIREYIAVEIKLAIHREKHGEPHALFAKEARAALEEQSTRCESEVRRLIPTIQKFEMELRESSHR